MLRPVNKVSLSWTGWLDAISLAMSSLSNLILFAFPSRCLVSWRLCAHAVLFRLCLEVGGIGAPLMVVPSIPSITSFWMLGVTWQTSSIPLLRSRANLTFLPIAIDDFFASRGSNSSWSIEATCCSGSKKWSIMLEGYWASSSPALEHMMLSSMPAKVLFLACTSSCDSQLRLLHTSELKCSQGFSGISSNNPHS